MPAVPAAQFIYFQLYMNGTGKVWLDDFQLLVDGKPIADAPSGIPGSPPLTRQNISGILGFENGTPGRFPFRWESNQVADAVIDDVIVHGGKYSARIERTPSSDMTLPFSQVFIAIPMDFAANTIELRGFAKTENVSDRIYLAIHERETEFGTSFEFGTTESSGIVRGTTDWTEYRVSLPAVAAAKVLLVTVTLVGTGKAWFDDLQLLVDGKPIAEAPDGIPSGTPTVPTRREISEILGFENGTPGTFPARWLGSGAAIYAVTDNAVVHGGIYSARLERGPSNTGTGGSIGFSLPIDFAGKTIQLRGFAKTENISDYLTLVLREDSNSRFSIEFGSTNGLRVKGTTDWTEYSSPCRQLPRLRGYWCSWALREPARFGWMIFSYSWTANRSPKRRTVYRAHSDVTALTRRNIFGGPRI